MKKKYNDNEYCYKNIKQIEKELECKMILENDEMNNKRIKSIEKNYIVLENFSEKSKEEIIYLHIMGYGLFYVILILFSILINKKIDNTIIVFGFIMLCIIAIFFIIDCLKRDKKKYKIENDFDKFIINDNKIIYHKDIDTVYIRHNVKKWYSKYQEKSNIRLTPFSTEDSKDLVIQYNKNGNVKKIILPLKYTNTLSVNEFIKLFKYE